MNFNEKQAAARDVIHGKVLEVQQLIVRAAKWRTCLNCINWKTKPQPICELYKQVPPAEIIVHGCRDWDDDIPF